MTIRDKIKACEFVSNNILRVQSDIIRRNSNKITNLNKNQFTDGLGSDNQPLFNVQRQFTGVYKAGFSNKTGLYDFYETGTFIRGLFARVGNDNNSIFIDSTGKGDGEKRLFITGYTNLFGLDSENMKILKYQIIKPELMKFIKLYL